MKTLVCKKKLAWIIGLHAFYCILSSRRVGGKVSWYRWCQSCVEASSLRNWTGFLSGSSGQDLLTVNTLKAGKRYWEKKLDTCTSLGVAHSPGFIFCPSADMVTNSFFSCCLFVNKSYICLEGKLMILHQGGGYGSLSFLLATPSSRTLEGLLGGLF